MSRFTTLYTAVSGLNAAQANLYVTGHNMSNVNIPGYTRQQVIQSDSYYNNIGSFHTGTLQLGLGTNVQSIRQIRDRYLDMAYRSSASTLGFYSTTYAAGVEIQMTIGEMEGEYKLSSVISDLKSSISELITDTRGIDVRGEFISTCIIFVDKANETYSNLRSQQDELNNNIIDMVKRINELVAEIEECSRFIRLNESTSDNANDYRDIVNRNLDELSNYLDIDYTITKNFTVNIRCEGKELLSNGVISKLGLRYSGPNNNFVEPVFALSDEIIPYDPTGEGARLLYSYDQPVTSQMGNDGGMLKGMLIARGTRPASYADSLGNLTPVPKPTTPKPDENDPDYASKYAAYEEEWHKYTMYIKDKYNIENCMIPRSQMQLDTLVHSIVTMINNEISPRELVNPNAVPGDPDYNVYKKKDPYPYGLDGGQDFMEIFVRNGNAYKYDENTGEILGEDVNDYYSLYTIGNFSINPELRNAINYKKLTLSDTGDHSNNDLLKRIIDKWDSASVGVDNDTKMTVEAFYQRIVTNISVEINKYETISRSEIQVLEQADYERLKFSGVSLDEEMTNMLRFQHAYNASARLVNYIDSMIDRIINNTGRVGL